jgi:malic enzyme
MYPICFLCIFTKLYRGGLDEDMLVAASYAIASLVEGPHLKEDYIIPKVNDPRILPIVTQTLKDAIKGHMTKGSKNMVLDKI